MLTLQAKDEAAQARIGACLAEVCLAEGTSAGCLIYLEGDLGAGKTTFARGFLRGMGHVGAVKSPTYTLIEPYEIGDRHCYHLDLYRLADPDELEYLGIRDMLQEQAVLLVEWPQQGGDALPVPDLWVRITYQGTGRELNLEGRSRRGRELIEALGKRWASKVKS